MTVFFCSPRSRVSNSTIFDFPSIGSDAISSCHVTSTDRAARDFSSDAIRRRHDDHRRYDDLDRPSSSGRGATTTTSGRATPSGDDATIDHVTSPSDDDDADHVISSGDDAMTSRDDHVIASGARTARGHVTSVFRRCWRRSRS